MIFRVLDIETIPDERDWKRPDPTYRLVPMYSQPTALAAAEAVEAFPPPHACRVVALSTVDVGFDPGHDPKYWLLGCRSRCEWSGDDVEADRLERDVLFEFGGRMDSDAAVHLVTWNGRGFDLPVIAMRSLRHKLACGWYYGNRDVRYRYSTEGHCDLMDFLTDYGGCRAMKLDEVSRSIGLPGKTDVHGGDVHAMYLNAVAHPERSCQLAAGVARYCQQDTIQTAVLWLRVQYLRGKITAETHDASLLTFRESAEVSAAIDLPWEKLLLKGVAP